MCSKDQEPGPLHQHRKCFAQKLLQRPERWILPGNERITCAVSLAAWQRSTRWTSYRTLSGSVTATLSRTEQAVSMLGSLLSEPLLLPLSDAQHCDRKSTSRVWLPKVSSTFRGPSSADRWHRAGRRYLKDSRDAPDRK